MFRKIFKKELNSPAMVVVFCAATLGLLASLVLSVEALVLAKNSNAVLSCSLNAVVDCAAVANHWSASLLGFPNSFIGLVAMPVVMTIAMSIIAGVKYPKWFMRATQAGAIAGLLFAFWMLYMSFAVIGIFCPWCLVFDAMMIVMFFGVTRYNVLWGYCPASKKLAKRIKPWFDKQYDILVMVSMIVIIIMAIIAKYGAELFS